MTALKKKNAHKIYQNCNFLLQDKLKDIKQIRLERTTFWFVLEKSRNGIIEFSNKLKMKAFQKWRLKQNESD